MQVVTELVLFAPQLHHFTDQIPDLIIILDTWNEYTVVIQAGQ